MKIIISDTFNKNFLIKFKKYFSVLDLVNELKKEKTNIILKSPFFKIKLRLNSVDFRGVILLVYDDKIVPLMLYLKKDKQNGENIIWSKYKIKILEIQDKISKDLEKGNFEMY